MPEQSLQSTSLPPDDLNRRLTVSTPNDAGLPHIGVVGDTYTVLLAGQDTNGRFCVIDMHVPPGGGPGPHRHDFEETFVVLEGEIEVTFRDEVRLVKAGTTANVPSNAPHCFQNKSSQLARLLCICSPAGIEEFFEQIGVAVESATTPPPAMTGNQMQDFIARARSLGPRYHTELLKKA